MISGRGFCRDPLPVAVIHAAVVLQVCQEVSVTDTASIVELNYSKLPNFTYGTTTQLMDNFSEY